MRRKRPWFFGDDGGQPASPGFFISLFADALLAVLVGIGMLVMFGVLISSF